MTDLGKAWDEQLVKLKGHFLQSSAWANFQRQLGQPVSHQQGANWQWLAFYRKAGPFSYFYCPYGPTALNQASLREALISLVKTAKQNGADFVRFEPISGQAELNLRSLGSRKVKAVQPEVTWVLDLAQSHDLIWSGLNSGHRSRIRTAPKRGVEIIKAQPLEGAADFIAMIKDTAKHGGFVAHPAAYYQKMIETLVPLRQAQVYLAKVSDQTVAAAIFFDFNAVRYYAHAAAFQQLNRQTKASVVLVYQAIIDAQKEGFKSFDFWGIAPTDDPQHPWAGLTAFKKGFGGELKRYAGTWEKPVRTGRYFWYRLARRILKR